MSCADCWHCWPRFTTAARCENHRAAGLRSPWLALDFVKLRQHCPGFKPLVGRSPQPETETP
jgi:hypothetical protein